MTLTPQEIADGFDAPIGDGQFLYRTTLCGECHLVEASTGFARVKIPYDYAFTCNSRQRRDAERIVAALTTPPPEPNTSAEPVGPVTVAQADREMAAKWSKLQSRHAQAANMLRGSCDTAPLVQLFARHRLQTEVALTDHATATRLLAEKDARIAELETERDAALRECSKWATEAGFAMGKLETSELAGVVDGWRARATAAEAEVERLREALNGIVHGDVSGLDDAQHIALRALAGGKVDE